MNRNYEIIDFSPESAPLRRTALLIYGAAVTVLLVLLGRNALTGSEGALAQSVREFSLGLDMFAGEKIFVPQSDVNLFAGKIYWLWSCVAGVSEWSLRLFTAFFALLLFSGTMTIAGKFLTAKRTLFHFAKCQKFLCIGFNFFRLL